MNKWRKNKMNIKKYIDSIDTTLHFKENISVVLYDRNKDVHLYLFNFAFDEEDNQYCAMLSEPISEDLPYVELSLPFINTLDEYYSSYKPIKESKDIGKHYKTIMKRLKQKEEKLLQHK